MSEIETLKAHISELGSKGEQLLKGDRPKDWRRTLGMFAGDEMMKEIDEEGRKIREADREAPAHQTLATRMTESSDQDFAMPVVALEEQPGGTDERMVECDSPSKRKTSRD